MDLRRLDKGTSFKNSCVHNFPFFPRRKKIRVTLASRQIRNGDKLRAADAFRPSRAQSHETTEEKEERKEGKNCIFSSFPLPRSLFPFAVSLQRRLAPQFAVWGGKWITGQSDGRTEVIIWRYIFSLLPYPDFFSFFLPPVLGFESISAGGGNLCLIGRTGARACQAETAAADAWCRNDNKSILTRPPGGGKEGRKKKEKGRNKNRRRRGGKGEGGGIKTRSRERWRVPNSTKRIFEIRVDTFVCNTRKNSFFLTDFLNFCF